ncbi:putative endonuclease lcl3 [Exophiala bonariae]|uniref:Probable endonuclease LCL3 n=1 Tax=Exophiala bonariae TaxID=1690606 RepID=A0AAV9N4V2_9EURO|nr:putative endonuclease lcl3 [Exophiala bonariae]
MTWLKLWSSSTKDDAKSTEPSRTTEAIESVTQTIDAATTSIQRETNQVLHSNVTAFTQPQTILATVVLTTASLGIFRFYKTYLRRIPQAVNINPSFLRRRSLVGRVTSVGDGDNFRIYHTPGGRLAGWGWFPGRRIPLDRKELKDQTIHVRLAGIDAPELAHFGRPAQPYGQEALEWLTSYVMGRRVRVYVYKADQYSRVVGSAYVWKGLWRRDVSMQMLKAGLATVYEAKSGVEFGKGDEQKYRKAEWWAKTKRKGMWSGKNKNFESPRDYKSRHGVGNPQNEVKP